MLQLYAHLLLIVNLKFATLQVAFSFN